MSCAFFVDYNFCIQLTVFLRKRQVVYKIHLKQTWLF